MPQITLTKEQLQGLPGLPGGVYEVRLDGFKPDMSKGRDGKQKSVNLNPQLKVINCVDHPDLNDRRVFENLNVNAGWVIKDFVHGFGMEMESTGDDGGGKIPGDFIGPEDNPKLWQYQGALLGRTAKVELVETEYNGKKSTKIKRYFCAVPGCAEAHSESLAQAS